MAALKYGVAFPIQNDYSGKVSFILSKQLLQLRCAVGSSTGLNVKKIQQLHNFVLNLITVIIL